MFMKIAIERKFEPGKLVIAEVADGKLTSSLAQEGEALDFDKIVTAADEKARVEFFAELTELAFKAPSKEEFRTVVCSILQLAIDLNSLYESSFLMLVLLRGGFRKSTDDVYPKDAVKSVAGEIFECDKFISWHHVMKKLGKDEHPHDGKTRDMAGYEIKCIDGSTSEIAIAKDFTRGSDVWMHLLAMKCPMASEIYHFTDEQTKHIVNILTAESHWTSKPTA